MKRFLPIFFTFALLFSPNYAMGENEFITQELLENPQQDEISLHATKEEDEQLLEDEDLDGVEAEFKIFSDMGKTKKTYEEQNFVQKIFKTKITRTDIPSYLLKDELTYNFKNGGKVELFAGYRGKVSALFNPHNYSTEYENMTTEFGFFGKTKDEMFDYRFSVLPVITDGRNYAENIWGDAFITYNKIPNNKILIGRSRGQVGMEGGNSAYTLPFVNRSQIARNFGNLRTNAIKLQGNYNYADYSISLGSSGRTMISGMPGIDFIGW